MTGPQKAKELIDMTGCDGIMIGRAAQGNPFIFREIVHYLETGELLSRPDKETMRNTVLRHAHLLVQYKGEYTAVREMRKHLSWYTVGYPHSARFRNLINSMETMEELLQSVEKIFAE